MYAPPEEKDVDKAEAALRMAAQFGQSGPWETAVLANGYQYRGDRFWKMSRETPAQEHREQKIDYLTRAQADYTRARDLLQGVTVGNAAKDLSKTTRDLREVEKELNKLREEPATQ